MNLTFTCTNCGDPIVVETERDEPSIHVTCDCGERHAVTISSLTISE